MEFGQQHRQQQSSTNTGAAHTCKAIAHGSREYQATVELRMAVLIGPLGLTIPPEALAAEAADFHLICTSPEGDLLACMILSPEENLSVRMRQVAVAAERQGEGIGTTLVEFAEQFARRKGFVQMTMHARETAVHFYERLSYERYGERFYEVTIPHWKMKKALQ